MDFFGRQEQARKRTGRLIFLFGLAVVCLVLGVYGVIGLALGVFKNGLWQPEIFGWTTLGTLLVISIGSLIKTAELRAGGAAVAQMLGGVPVDPNTTNLDERKLINVVEEMSIASGTPMPQLFVLNDESGINAFAAGHSTTDMAVGVTRGCMHLLTRDELQGVIAHEFSHILNGDMRLNLRLMGIIHGILCLAILGRVLLSARTRSSSSRKENNPLPLIGLALLILGWVGVLFGSLIKSAVSRQREYLADAAATQFTRNPEGLAGALKKIGGLAAGSQLETAEAESASHLFFANGLAESWLSLMSTHPPLVERIRALDPQFDGVYPEVQLVRLPPVPTREARLAPAESKPPPLRIPTQFRPADLLGSAGSITPQQLLTATLLRDSLPNSLTAAAREPLGAASIVYGLLLPAQETEQQPLLEVLSQGLSPLLATEIRRLWPSLESLPAAQKLPLADLCVPALRRLSPPQYLRFMTCLDHLVAADQQIDLFEFTLQKLVRRHLTPHFKPMPPPVARFHAIQPLTDECQLLLSALANVGHADQPSATNSFRVGWRKLESDAPALPLLSREDCSLTRIDLALNRLAEASPGVKRRILNACALTVAADNLIRPAETELLRAIADAMDCPVPPPPVAAEA